MGEHLQTLVAAIFGEGGWPTLLAAIVFALVPLLLLARLAALDVGRCYRMFRRMRAGRGGGRRHVVVGALATLAFADGTLFSRDRRTLVRRAPVPVNPWNAGTVEWLPDIPNPPWGVRSIPVISSRYPLWDQPGLADDVQAGRFYLSDAPEGRRETLVTSTLDALPQQCLRVPGPSFLAFWSAVLTGGVFIFPVYELYVAAAVSGFLAIVTILAWLWTGTALQPEREVKDVGLGLALPLYASGAQSVGWWAMCITMIGDMTAFASLVFGYFFFWTVHADFPPPQAVGPGVGWLLLGLLLATASWGCTLLARRWNAASARGPARRQTAGHWRTIVPSRWSRPRRRIALLDRTGSRRLGRVHVSPLGEVVPLQ